MIRLKPVLLDPRGRRPWVIKLALILGFFYFDSKVKNFFGVNSGFRLFLVSINV